MLYGAASGVPYLMNDRVTRLTLLRAAQGEAVSHIGKGQPGIQATFWPSAGPSRACRRRDAKLLAPRSESAHNAVPSRHFETGFMTQAEVTEAILERFKRPRGVKVDANLASASQRAAGCSQAAFPGLPAAYRSIAGDPFARVTLSTVAAIGVRAVGSTVRVGTARRCHGWDAGRDLFPGPADARRIGLGLSGSARRRRVARAATQRRRPDGFQGQ